ncbi:hypothetical protein SH467x_000118 [Pirellulaceae bacterium SH467]
MPLSRNHRQDRRRRVMLDSLAQDTELAVETVRARRRTKSRVADDEEDYDRSYRDPGYSQAVRSTCQQRLVQFIPVRRGTVAILLTGLWFMFGLLLFTHYWIHTSSSATATATLTNLPIGYLFHLRSPHGIAHWLTSQLWLLTSLASCMIFNLRRHKLDDYRARYRIWVFIALAALFSSFDASTSVLQLIGMSIDSWARKEIGYGGWPLVLASFASLIGVLGIRLSSELRSVPSSVTSWIFGLVAWAVSALLGTGLLKVAMPPQQLDLLVGGLWLGGILAVFQSAAMYLRTTYIQAQKRFLQRQGCELGPIRWKVPAIKLPRRHRDEIGEAGESGVISARGKKKTRVEPPESGDLQEEPSHRGWKFWRRRQEDGVEDISEEESDERNSESGVKSASQGRRLFGWIPNRQIRNEELEYEPIAEDEGGEVDTGLTKTSGWFGIGGNQRAEREARRSEKESKRASKAERETVRRDDPDAEPLSKKKGSWWSRKGPKAHPEDRGLQGGDGESAVAPTKRKWIPPLPSIPKVSLRKSRAPVSGSPESRESDNDNQPARGGLFRRNRGKDQAAVDADAPNKSLRRTERSEGRSEPKEKKSWLGMFDGLALKPPKVKNDEESARDLPPSTSSKPSSSPTPVKTGASIPSTRDYEDEDDSDSRPMSKAERKRLRRQQDDRRAA